ncbi:MAG TPA: hypothetical protein VMR31_06275, partial [Myxococcota bacterium]|nr:hypothetical protein [Myxococcota bacterium]
MLLFGATTDALELRESGFCRPPKSLLRSSSWQELWHIGGCDLSFDYRNFVVDDSSGISTIETTAEQLV